MSCRCYVGDVWGKHIPKKGRANLKLWERTRWLEQREEEGEWEERCFSLLWLWLFTLPHGKHALLTWKERERTFASSSQ